MAKENEWTSDLHKVYNKISGFEERVCKALLDGEYDRKMLQKELKESMERLEVSKVQ